jgi:gluconate 2-dehydrogenase gamma chain
MTTSITRREILKALARGSVIGAVAGIVPLATAERLHRNIEAGRATASRYKPKFFSAHQYKTLQALCQAIIPADEHIGGAIEAGAPEFIDLLTSENSEYQLKLGASCGSMLYA